MKKIITTLILYILINTPVYAGPMDKVMDGFISNQFNIIDATLVNP